MKAEVRADVVESLEKLLEFIEVERESEAPEEVTEFFISLKRSEIMLANNITEEELHQIEEEEYENNPFL